MAAIHQQHSSMNKSVKRERKQLYSPKAELTMWLRMVLSILRAYSASYQMSVHLSLLVHSGAFCLYCLCQKQFTTGISAPCFKCVSSGISNSVRFDYLDSVFDKRNGTNPIAVIFVLFCSSASSLTGLSDALCWMLWHAKVKVWPTRNAAPEQITGKAAGRHGKHSFVQSATKVYRTQVSRKKSTQSLDTQPLNLNFQFVVGSSTYIDKVSLNQKHYAFTEQKFASVVEAHVL